MNRCRDSCIISASVIVSFVFPIGSMGTTSSKSNDASAIAETVNRIDTYDDEAAKIDQENGGENLLESQEDASNQSSKLAQIDERHDTHGQGKVTPERAAQKPSEKAEARATQQYGGGVLLDMDPSKVNALSVSLDTYVEMPSDLDKVMQAGRIAAACLNQSVEGLLLPP